VRLGSNPKLDLLRKVPLFSRCSKDDLERIALIADEMDFAEGKDLIRQGERGRQFFILLEGTAEVERNGERIASMGPGDFFGEISLLADRETTASVTTSSPSRVLVITPYRFRQLLRESESIQAQVLQEVVHRLPAD
jgi:CRP/FNR family cyclic AMP-dependent transcriptional regulator